MNLLWLMDPPSESRIDSLNTSTQNLADEHTLADGPPMQCIMGYILWDVFAAILDSSGKGGDFLLFLNNYGSKQSVSIVVMSDVAPP